MTRSNQRHSDHRVLALLQILDIASERLEGGTLTRLEMALIATIPYLGIDPPKPSPDRPPLKIDGVLDAPGSWPQYVEIWSRAFTNKWDFQALVRDEKIDERAARDRAFYAFGIHSTVRGIEKGLVQIRAQRAASHPMDRDRLRRILQNKITQFEDRGDDLLPAVEHGARWIFEVLIKSLANGDLTTHACKPLVHEIWSVIRDEEDLAKDAMEALIERLKDSELPRLCPRFKVVRSDVHAA